jgi:hypothetical protein
MRTKKITGMLMATMMAFSLGVVAVPAAPVEAATVVSSSRYETVTLFSKADLKNITGVSLTTQNVTTVHNELKQAATWEKAGYNAADAKLIANRFTQSGNQAIQILTKVAYGKLNLKVVVINKPNYTNANIGVSGQQIGGGGIETPDVPETETPETGVPETEAPVKVQSELKEIQIDVDYKRGSIEFEYEVKYNGTVKAEYENDFTGENLHGKAAQNKIEAILAGLDVEGSSQSTIVNHILGKLNQGQTYKQFQFEAEYYDGTEREFKLR